MNKEGIDQVPIISENDFVGSLSDGKVLKALIDNPGLRDQPVKEIMDKPFPFMSPLETIDVLSSMISNDLKALMTRDSDNKPQIITQSDLLVAMTN